MTRTDEVLAVLQAGGKAGVTTRQMLASTSHRYSAYILRLRERGYVITSVKERDGSWRYTLIREPGAAQAPPPPVTTFSQEEAPAIIDGQEQLFDVPPHENRYVS
jgi:hypothetical protein